MTNEDGRLTVSYDRFVRDMGETTVVARIAPGPVVGGSARLAVAQDFLLNYEVAAVTPEPSSATAQGDHPVHEFPADPSTGLSVRFDLRPSTDTWMCRGCVGHRRAGVT